MTKSNFDDQIIALAGCCQAAGMVYKLSQTGEIEDELMTIAVNSVLKLEAQNTLEIFGGIKNLQPGLRLLKEQLYPQGKRNMDIGRYVANLLSLQGQLMRSSELVKTVQMRLTQINRQKSLLERTEADQIVALSTLYQECISTLPLRIQVTGHARFLQKDLVQKQVRTALFFGLRCALLWNQLGGRKRDFLFSRKAMYKQIQQHLC